MISFMMAAATIVPEINAASSGSIALNAFTAIPVKTSDTPECGSNVNPRYFVTVGSAFVILPPRYELPIFPIARDTI